MRRIASLTTGPTAILILFALTLILGRFGSPLALATLGLMLQKVHGGLALFLVFLGLSAVLFHC